jgi:nifR3 family TIM-barrel protein
VSIPVTVKIRAGWDENSVNAPEMAKILEGSGASAIFVHARTRAQLYSPGIDLGVIEAVKNAVSIPVIGNGDIYSAENALAMMEKTGCDGVMIGRGAMGNPWIFSQIISLENGVGTPFPTVSERMETAKEHLLGMIEHKGERVGLAEAKKHMSWYLHGLRGAAAARSEIMNAHSAQEVLAILRRLEREQNEGD